MGLSLWPMRADGRRVQTAALSRAPGRSFQRGFGTLSPLDIACSGSDLVNDSSGHDADDRDAVKSTARGALLSGATGLALTREIFLNS